MLRVPSCPYPLLAAGVGVDIDAHVRVPATRDVHVRGHVASGPAGPAAERVAARHIQHAHKVLDRDGGKGHLQLLCQEPHLAVLRPAKARRIAPVPPVGRGSVALLVDDDEVAARGAGLLHLVDPLGEPPAAEAGPPSSVRRRLKVLWLAQPLATAIFEAPLALHHLAVTPAAAVARTVVLAIARAAAIRKEDAGSLGVQLGLHLHVFVGVVD
mmetsp:Transcript_48561/g.138807  ORF Transcript_48561/g.138807 Transcript_48561/m.138807 type:complete len:213 (+) Transcript_48561:498-1136(+)